MAILDLLHEADLIDQDIPNPAEILPRPGYAAITLYGGGQGLTLAYGISSTASGLGPAGLALILSGGSGIAVGRGLDVGSEVVFGTSISELLSRAVCAADPECL